MSFTKSLYYPRTEIDDEGWLKSAILYWDEIQTIAPASMPEPYSTRTARELHDARVLSPLFVHPEMPTVEPLAEKVIDYIASPEAERLMLESGIDEYTLMHPEKLPELDELVAIDPEKLPYVVRHRLGRFIGGEKEGWLRVHPALFNFYMTLLATELSANAGIGLLTDMPSSENLANAARLEGPLGLSQFREPYPRHLRYSRPMSVRRMPSEAAQAVLAQLTLRHFTVDPDTPVHQILKFREDHKGEIGRFRAKLSELTKSVGEDLPVEDLQQRVADTYTHEVGPALEELKEAFNYSRIKYAITSLLKTSMFTVPAGSVMHRSLGSPLALLAMTGISLTACAVQYNRDRREDLRQNPFSFVVAPENRFGAR